MKIVSQPITVIAKPDVLLVYPTLPSPTESKKSTEPPPPHGAENPTALGTQVAASHAPIKSYQQEPAAHGASCNARTNERSLLVTTTNRTIVNDNRRRRRQRDSSDGVDDENGIDDSSSAFSCGICNILWLILGSWAVAKNENHYLTQQSTLEHGLRNVVALTTDNYNNNMSMTIDPSLEGALVYLTAEATTTEQLFDPIFGQIQTGQHALKLYRGVEMYQWVENQDKDNDNDEYTYSKQWKSKLVNSHKFNQPTGHENPTTMRFQSKTYVADLIEFGPYDE